MSMDEVNCGITRKGVAFDDYTEVVRKTYGLAHPDFPIPTRAIVLMLWEKEPNVKSVTRTTRMTKSQLAEYLRE